MSDHSGEGEEFAAKFGAIFGSPERTEARLKAERRAGMTPKQRARRATKTVQVNFRATPEIKALADALADKHEMSVADVIARAIEEFAARSKIERRRA